MRSTFGLAAAVAIAFTILGPGRPAAGQILPGNAVEGEDIQAMALRISGEVARLRGLEFKRPLKVENQSLEEFGAYLDAELEKQNKPEMARHFDAVVRKLGLYRGPVIEDMNAMLKGVMTSQAAAYYDPEAEAFYVLIGEMDAMMMGTVYAHEIYHGLQDQYFDLNRYLVEPAGGDEMSEDEVLARQAVVEGEATYVMMLWTLENMTGEAPNPMMVDMMVQMQSQMTTEQMQAMFDAGVMGDDLPEDMRAAIEAMDEIPRFILETMMGSYMKGMAFVHEIHEAGWERVEELYGGRPPLSTEHILHPEKWVAGEGVTRLTWPEFEGEAALADWELIDEDVLGEIQWRIVFEEFEMPAIARGAAAGWDGDRYAVLKARGGDDWLLLLRTAWDTDEDAEEFMAAYEDLLRVKYEGGGEAVAVERAGREVFIVEGGTKEGLADLMAFVKRAERERVEWGNK